METSGQPPTEQSEEINESPQTPARKRLKTLSSVFCLSLSPCKGKSKIEGLEEEAAYGGFERHNSDSELIPCGICLSDNENSIRGWIDSCDHYFCFVCIMEWAKVESKCPMCKRRFSTIRRPPMDKVFLSERVVNVPVRDQVYHYFGNATVGPHDHYAEVRCSVCLKTTDDSLLLLCDLCDSASHTYCVGLGATVPEGDWFCQDCTITKSEHAKSVLATNCDNLTSSRKFDKMPIAEVGVSLSNIISESSITEIVRPSTSTRLQANMLSPTVHNRENSVTGIVSGSGRRLHVNVEGTATKLGARTLLRCRNVHDRIKALRENWNGLQNGSFRFSAKSADCDGSTSQMQKISGVFSGGSVRLHTSHLREESSEQNSYSSELLHNRDPYDVGKAWKMMDSAKKIERNCKRTVAGSPPSKTLMRKVNCMNEGGDTDSNFLASNRKESAHKDHGSLQSKKFCLYQSIESDKNLMFENKEHSWVSAKRVLKFSRGFTNTPSPEYCELPSSRKFQTSVIVDTHCGNLEKLHQENSYEAPSNLSGLGCPQAKSPIVVSNAYKARLDLHADSSSNIGPPKRECRIKVSVADKTTGASDAKCEIQSLVKLNLKLLTKDRKLEAEAFKKVARLATHSILAACGLEHPKPGVYSFSSSVCHHAEEFRELRRSTLMDSCCRECFYVFVKDVVNVIMLSEHVLN